MSGENDRPRCRVEAVHQDGRTGPCGYPLPCWRHPQPAGVSGETGGGLTAEERERVLIASHTVERQHELGEALFAVVERILADRDAALARVEALHYTVATVGHGAWCHHDGQRIPCDTLRALHPDPKPHPFAHPHGAETVTGVSVGNTATGEVIGSVQIDPAPDPRHRWGQP